MIRGTQHQPKALHLRSFSVCFRSSVDKAAEEMHHFIDTLDNGICFSLHWRQYFVQVLQRDDIYYKEAGYVNNLCL